MVGTLLIIDEVVTIDKKEKKRKEKQRKEKKRIEMKGKERN